MALPDPLGYALLDYADEVRSPERVGLLLAQTRLHR